MKLLFCLSVLVLFSLPVNARWVDLTHPLDGKTILTPKFKGWTEKGYWYEANEIRMNEHGGTHLDAPVHFAKGKWTTERIPLERLIGEACVLDLSEKMKNNAEALISAEEIAGWEKTHGKIPEGAIVLVRTGWSPPRPGKKGRALRFPGFSAEGAEFLVRRKIGAVGLDTPSLDYAPSQDFPAHRIFGKDNIPGFENVANLHLLPPRGSRVVALPMKISGGSGGPLRIIAEIP